MVKQIRIIPVVWLSLSSLLNAMEISAAVTSKPNFSIKKYADIDTIADLATKAAKLVIKGIPFTEIAVVFDVDGTLTTHGIPDDDYNEDTEVRARGEAVEVIHWMMSNKINVIFSSAWDNFDHTLSRLHKLGLGDSLKGTKISKDFIYHGCPYRVNALGRAVSVSSPPPTPARPYYRGKAYSAYFFNPGLAKKAKAILFADDSDGNVKTFQNHLRSNASNFYPNLQKLYLYTMNETYDQSNGWPQALEDIQKILAPCLDTHQFATEMPPIQAIHKQDKLHERSSEKEQSKSKKPKSDKSLRENKRV